MSYLPRFHTISQPKRLSSMFTTRKKPVLSLSKFTEISHNLRDNFFKKMSRISHKNDPILIKGNKEIYKYSRRDSKELEALTGEFVERSKSVDRYNNKYNGGCVDRRRLPNLGLQIIFSDKVRYDNSRVMKRKRKIEKEEDKEINRILNSLDEYRQQISEKYNSQNRPTQSNIHKFKKVIKINKESNNLYGYKKGYIENIENLYIRPFLNDKERYVDFIEIKRCKIPFNFSM